ncbi:MAG TPA: ABC transporter permease [Phycisphaerales bacterium]|nr:ABC transporter permease [Phycisphaerales bacterium]HMP36840.1 ABC transporter permease [Phycisphaerales bacterium]
MNGPLSKVGAVAWREFRHTALTKGFLFGAFGVPLIMIALVALLPSLVGQELLPLRGTVAVVTASDRLPKEIETELRGARLEDRILEIARNGRAGSRPRSAGTGAADPEAVADALDRRTGRGESDADAANGADGGGARIDGTEGDREGAGGRDGVDRAAGDAGSEVDVALRVVNPSDDPTGEFAALKELVLAGELVALAVVPPEVLDPAAEADRSARVQLFVPPGFLPNHTILLRGAIADAAARTRAAAAGVDYDAASALVRAPRTDLRRLDPAGGDRAEQLATKLLIPAAFMLLLWMSVFVSANHLLTSTIEEKGSKVIEVLLSAVSPMQLMAGKILGQGMVSAVMLITYGGVGMASLAAMATLDLVPWMHLVYLAIYFVMAYFMIASVMAGVGSAANDLHEAQSLVAPAMIVLMVPLMLWFPISQNPNGALALATSFIPPLIPFVMILRVTTANEPIAAWQILASIAWGFAAMLGMIWLAARVFRIGVLMQGKTPTPRELVRWMLTP